MCKPPRKQDPKLSRSGEAWTQLDDQRAVEMYREGKTMRQIAAAVQRHHDEVRERLKELIKP